jgi:drug/metabolite transporter (DMT)-like permease
VLGERPSPVELVAAVVIIGGVLLGTPRAKPQERHPRPIGLDGSAARPG